MRNMDLNDLLREQGIDPHHKRVLVLRHTPKEPRLRKVLPWLAAERPDLYNAYQQTQTRRVEKKMKEAEYVASFIGHEPDKARFVGLYKCRGKPHRLTKTTYGKVPENRELRKFGARTWTTDEDDRRFVLWFDLELQKICAHWKDRLVINWPGGGVNWSRWANENTFQVLERIDPKANDSPSVKSPAAEWHDPTPEGSDLPEPPERLKTTTYRILRDTAKARHVKALHEFKCQICEQAITLPDGSLYAEAHHIQPLGGEHKGPDVISNILCVCPNHHAELDLGASSIKISTLHSSKEHEVGSKYVDYHNKKIVKHKDQ